jgi:hypothetical protein
LYAKFYKNFHFVMIFYILKAAATAMKMVLSVNDRRQAMLMHDEPLGFQPYWCEYSPSYGGIRLVSREGREYKTGVTVLAEALDMLDDVTSVLIVQIVDKKAVEGYNVSFVKQD